MASQDPTLVASYDATSWIADDGAQIDDRTSCATDDEIPTNCVDKIGKNPDDVLRIEIPTLADAANGGTITVEITDVHQISGFAMLPYTSAVAVSATNKITASGGTGTKVFTLTTDFLNDLHDLGSGKAAVRLTEDNGIC